MKRALLIPILLLAAACASHQAGSTSSGQPGHGAISMTVVPNPIVATSLGGGMYEFPFEVVLRETGGHPVTITRVSADVYAFGSMRVATESYDAAKINSLGYSTTLPANGELRYAFRPRKEVTDERLFGGVTAEVRVDAVDDTGTAASSSTTVGVRR
ncbi:MAG TPA: hypothetical protein VK504_06025 [Vicinamibacterales bacterium]|nr:hypothetical protein [Vicinamibacterales bacterium]